jgi:hypothetical protein
VKPSRWLVVIALGASACAPVEGITPAAASLKGQPVSSVVARLGAPDSQQQIEGRTAYVWTSETRAPAIPLETTTVNYAAGVPNTVETLRTPVQGQLEACTLRVFVDGAGSVVATTWQGSKAGCQPLAQKLDAKT